MTGIRILDPGLSTTVQDLGRSGYQRFGIPVSGVLDREAMRLANALAGAAPHAAILELRYIGPRFEVETDHLRIAVSGASIKGQVSRAGETLAFGADRSVTLARGDMVQIGPLQGSSCACLALSAPLDLEPVLGSRSTYAKGGFGGHQGRALQAGDRLALKKCAPTTDRDRALATPLELTGTAPIRVVLGPQDDHFTDASIETFLNTDWTITKDADRMGMRLDGPELTHRDGYNITSDGIAPGSIQVPGSRLPIILLADRQTTGGYPKIATVISADLPRLGRLAPGAKLRFQHVTSREAVEVARAREAELQEMISTIGRYHPPGEIDTEALYTTELISPPIGLE